MIFSVPIFKAKGGKDAESLTQ